MKTKLLLLPWLFSFSLSAQERDSLQPLDLDEKLHVFITYCDLTANKMLQSDQLDSIRFYAHRLMVESDQLMQEIRLVIPPKDCETAGFNYMELGLGLTLLGSPLAPVYMALGDQRYMVCEEDPAFVQRVRDIRDFAGQLSQVRKLEKAWRKTTRMMLECRNMRHVLPGTKGE